MSLGIFVCFPKMRKSIRKVFWPLPLLPICYPMGSKCKQLSCEPCHCNFLSCSQAFPSPGKLLVNHPEISLLWAKNPPSGNLHLAIHLNHGGGWERENQLIHLLYSGHTFPIWYITSHRCGHQKSLDLAVLSCLHLRVIKPWLKLLLGPSKAVILNTSICFPKNFVSLH